MSYIKHLRKAWLGKESQELMKERKIEWRREPATIRVERPTKIDKAKSLGYKAKQGFLVVRERLKRGGRMTEQVSGGRRSKRSGRNKVVGKSYQTIAEERVAKKFPNCEVLNSYYVTKDGVYIWYEVILLDRAHPRVMADKDVNWAFFEQGRVFRGKTSSGRKGRGLRTKGKGSEKVR